MNTLDFSLAELKHVITHHVGNPSREEKLTLSNEVTAVNEDTRDVIMRYFVASVNAEEFYAFAPGNEVVAIAQHIFADPDSFISYSKELGKRLFEQTNHPKIKEGELNVVLFSNVILNNERVEALGLFKSEVAVPFVSMTQERVNYKITHASGFDMKGADKGCIIFNKDAETGFKIVVGDRVNKSDEAQYWKNDFLQVTPLNDAFLQTKQAISVTSEFIKDRLPEEFNINKADQIDLINRSLKYFKKNESFSKSDFEENILQDPDLIKSYRTFEQGFRSQNNIDSIDEFDISQQAVKRQTRFLKSVLKLDKNFHIYIHGNRELIQQGIESNGRKFYKIYFDKEA